MAQPGLFRRECEALGASGRRLTVFVDEAQLMPSVFDAVQVLYEREPERFILVLCGSSARKLRESGANLLPGRSLLHRLYPLILAERPGAGSSSARLAILPSSAFKPSLEGKDDLLERQAYRDLPGILRATEAIRERPAHSPCNAPVEITPHAPCRPTGLI